MWIFKLRILEAKKKRILEAEERASSKAVSWEHALFVAGTTDRPKYLQCNELGWGQWKEGIGDKDKDVTGNQIKAIHRNRRKGRT